MSTLSSLTSSVFQDVLVAKLGITLFFAAVALSLALSATVVFVNAQESGSGGDGSSTSGAEGTQASVDVAGVYLSGPYPGGAPSCAVGQTPIMHFESGFGYYYFSGQCEFTGCPDGYQQNGDSCDATPACVADYGQACSGSNQCGVLNGTVQCDGSCSVGGPTLPNTYGWACGSAANSCGMTNRGTIACDGVTCDALTPPENMCRDNRPSGCGSGTRNDTCRPLSCEPTTASSCGQTATYYPCRTGSDAFVITGTPDTSIPFCPGWRNPDSPNAGSQCWSAPNACGERIEGVIQNSGLCNASSPPNSCMLPGSGGGWTGSASPSGGGSPVPTYVPIPEPLPQPPSFVPFTTTAPGFVFNASGHLQARPTLVRANEKTRLYWKLTNVSSCTVTGTNGDSWSGSHSGNSGALSSAIVTRTTYTLRCTALPRSGGANITESVIINIAPRFNES